jgi:hypothetical protein
MSLISLEICLHCFHINDLKKINIELLINNIYSLKSIDNKLTINETFNSIKRFNENLNIINYSHNNYDKAIQESLYNENYNIFCILFSNKNNQCIIYVNKINKNFIIFDIPKQQINILNFDNYENDIQFNNIKSYIFKILNISNICKIEFDTFILIKKNRNIDIEYPFDNKLIKSTNDFVKGLENLKISHNDKLIKDIREDAFNLFKNLKN